MITRFYIDNFKSLVDFDLELAKFNCLIGLNGAGKSTVLQALDFVSAMMTGDVVDWLENRKWHPYNLCSNLDKSFVIKTVLDLEIKSGKYQWSSIFNTNGLECLEEKIISLSDDRIIFLNQNGKYAFDNSLDVPIAFEYTGSVLSQIKPELMSAEVLAFKNHLVSLRSLDLLSPQNLRKPAQVDPSYQKNSGGKSRYPLGFPILEGKPHRGRVIKSDIGMEGEQLPVFIHNLTSPQRKKLVDQLRGYYPQILDVNTKVSPSGWVSLEIRESFKKNDKKNHVTNTTAQHINDGMLRLIAILAQQFSSLEILLFDEIENGINAEITESLVSALVTSPKQIIVTTHSPMFLNYMDDEVAKSAVVLLYKTENGVTHATRFFDVPSVAKKLETLPPGAAMLDLYLQDVATEVEKLQNREMWQGASIKFNQANGSLSAEKSGKTAIALKPKGEELLSTLSPALKQKVLTNQFVKVNVQVLNKELLKILDSE